MELNVVHVLGNMYRVIVSSTKILGKSLLVTCRYINGIPSNIFVDSSIKD